MLQFQGRRDALTGSMPVVKPPSEEIPGMSTMSQGACMSAVAVSLASLSLAGVLPTRAQDAGSIVKLPHQIEYQSAPGGVGPETTVLYGDPTKPGVFVMRAKFAKGAKVMPSWRPDAWRTAVVLSGTLYYGVGERWDETKLQAYPTGTFFSHPSKHSHFAWAKDGEVIVQFTAMGPTSITRIPQK
jgi:hypothetical protein